jgi:4-amino-4-deoxy-L-arabinose transferase-like glycosyltransferase
VNHDFLARPQTPVETRHGIGEDKPVEYGAIASSSNSKKIELKCIWAALLLGFFQVFNSRWALGPDGISYLDLGELWLKGDIANAVNGYWNPVYPIVLGIASKLIGNALYEPVATHAVHFVIYCLNLFLFSRLLRTMRRIRFASDAADSQSNNLFTLLAYVLFVWCHCSLVDLGTVSPDLILISTIILSTIFLVRLIESDNSLSSAAGLGLALGFGYLTKAVMFMAAPFFIVAALLCAKSLARGWRNAAVAAVIFFTVSVPYIFLLSRQRGHLTYSESGKLAYAWEVNRTREYFHWQGAEPGSGSPVHATRQLLRDPEVFEFGDRPGTYPPWFDPSYWHEGLKVRLDLRRQIHALLRDFRGVYLVCFEQPTSIIFLVVFAVGLSAISFRNHSRFRRTWPLLIPALAGFCVYLAVFVISRHLAPFILPLYLTALWNTWPAAKRLLPERAVIVMAACAVMPILYLLTDPGLGINKFYRNEAIFQKRVALALKEFGLQPGDRIAIMGRGCEAAFARMAQVKIVAEGFRGDGEIAPSWAVIPEKEILAVEALRSVRVKAIVRDTPALFESKLNWKPVPNTPFSVLFPSDFADVQK